MKRYLWIDILAGAPLVALGVFAPETFVAMVKLDPLVIFRILMALWVVAHVVFNVQRLIEQIVEVRQFFRSMERVLPRSLGLAITGDRMLAWSAMRIVRIALRRMWPTAALGLVVVAVNAAAWMVLKGWWPEFLRS